MQEDPRALKLYVDGSCYAKPWRASGCAGVAVFPESLNRADEVIFQEGYHQSTNNRMELTAFILAMEYAEENYASIGVNRIQIITDSLYVYDNHKNPPQWRGDG